MASNYHPKGLLCAFAEEILRRTDPESPVVHVCKIENNSDVLIHETRETSALHSPNGDINDRMAPDVAEILAAREDETYAPVPRKYFDFTAAMASSLTTCIMYERRETWELIQRHPLFVFFESPEAIKSQLIHFFNMRYSSLFADITDGHITLDPAGIEGSITYLRLPDELPHFKAVSTEFAMVPMPKIKKEQKEDEGMQDKIDLSALTDTMCIGLVKGLGGQLFVFNLFVWARLLHEADPYQKLCDDVAVLFKAETGLELRSISDA